jgi:hypothetical protein
LKIVVDSAAILAEWHDGAAVSYGKPRATRQSGNRALVDGSFRLQEEKIIWRHLHETAIA